MMKILNDYTKYDSETDLEFMQKLQNLSANDNIIMIPEMTKEDEKNFAIVRRWGNGEWWTQQYVGILEISGESVFIGSRFDDEEDYWFTHYILSRAMGMKANIFQDMNPKIGLNDVLEELLAIVLISQIEKAYRKGLYRRYRSYECNDSKVKGKIDIARHIQLNLLFNGNIAYSYREFTTDNNINKIILTAFSYLEKRHPQMIQGLLKYHKNTEECIKQLKRIVTPASRQEIQKLVQRERKKISHPLYHDWEMVRRTAIMVLRHMGIEMTKEQNQECSGVLINMNRIWELYLECILKEHIRDSYTINAQEERGILYQSSDSKPKRNIRPDFCVYKNQKNPEIVIDAKYKNQWEEIASGKKDDWQGAREDIFQIISYMHLYQCKKSGIICPCRQATEKLNNTESIRYIISQELNEEQFKVLPLVISSKEEMKNNEEKLIGELENLMDK